MEIVCVCACPRPHNGFGIPALVGVVLAVIGIVKAVEAAIHWWVFDVWQRWLCATLWDVFFGIMAAIGAVLMVLVAIAVSKYVMWRRARRSSRGRAIGTERVILVAAWIGQLVHSRQPVPQLAYVVTPEAVVTAPPVPAIVRGHGSGKVLAEIEAGLGDVAAVYADAKREKVFEE